MTKIILAWAFVLIASTASAESFCFHPPGVLVPEPAAGKGLKGDRAIYIPDMAFPLEVGPQANLHAYLNSQIFGYGGMNGPSGAPQKNYKYCWADTYCENRGWNMPLCPSGKGHQGNDIRPEAPKNNTYKALAFADGVVTLITRNTTVAIVSDDGTQCRYLHLDPSSIKDNVKVGQRVVKGKTVVGKVADVMGKKPHGTSIHLHFDCSQTLEFDDGTRANVHVPVYTSLIKAYATVWGYAVKTDGNELSPGSEFEK